METGEEALSHQESERGGGRSTGEEGSAGQGINKAE